jgi:predicted HTH domain antitoxin
MRPLILEIPPEILQSLKVPPQEVEERLRLELALTLYSQKLLSSGKACALAGLSRWAWEEVLGKRHIPRHYSEEDLAEDLRHAKRGQ